jgi:hypothetical protein
MAQRVRGDALEPMARRQRRDDAVVTDPEGLVTRARPEELTKSKPPGGRPLRCGGDLIRYPPEDVAAPPRAGDPALEDSARQTAGSLQQ